MKIVVLLSRVPYPLEKGDKLRAYYQIRELSKNHEIYLVALNDTQLHPDAIKKLQPICKELIILNLSWWSRFVGLIKAFFTKIPFQCGYFYSRKAKKQFHQHVERIQPDHIYAQIIRVAEYVKMLPYPKTLDYQDVFSMGIYRRYQKAPFYLKPLFLWEYKKLQRYENHVFSLFDNLTIITAIDRSLIPHPDRNKIHVIANGVDLSIYNSINVRKNYDLIFSGNMNYPPNIDAAEYLAKKIFPELKETYPYLKLVLCGASPHARVKALAGEDIIVTGWVDSMVDYYAQSKIFIAPMRLGTGLQNKLMEAMAMKLPCITSPLAGKPLEGIQYNRDIIVCESTDDYIEAVKMLIENPDKYHEIRNNGYQFVKERYDWEKIAAKLEQLMSGN